MATSGEVRRSMGAFRRWNETREPLQNSEGKTFKFKKRERIVPAYDYRTNKLDKRYYVTENGIVLSFCSPSNPIVTKQTPDGDYLNTINWKVHRLVWFSFAYDALANGTELPLHFGITLNNVKDLKAIKPTMEVHHITGKRNCIGNLKLMDKPFNLMLRTLGLDTATEKKKWDTFVKQSDKLSKVTASMGAIATVTDQAEDLVELTPEDNSSLSKQLNLYLFYKKPLHEIIHTLELSLEHKFRAEVLSEKMNIQIFLNGNVHYFEYQNRNAKYYPVMDKTEIDIIYNEDVLLLQNPKLFKKYLQKSNESIPFIYNATTL